MKFNKQHLADLSLIFVAILWGGGFIAVKDALDTLTPMYLMAFRMTVAAITFLFLFPKLRGLSWQDVRYSLVVASMLYLGFAFQTVGLQFTDVSKQGFLTATYVVIVPLLYWLFYKKLPERKVFAGCVLVLVGIGLVSLSENFSLGIGDTLTLVCAVFFAVHIIATAKALEKVDPFKLAFLQFAIAALLFGATAAVTEPFPVGTTVRTWGAIIYGGVVATFVCFLVQTIAQKYTTPSKTSLFLSLESVFAAIFGVMLLGEELTLRKLVGFALIFASILLIELDIPVFQNKAMTKK